MSDYTPISQALRFIEKQTSTPPTPSAIATHLNLSLNDFHKLMGRWLGNSSQHTLQLLTPAQAKIKLTRITPLTNHASIQLETTTRTEHKKTKLNLPIEYGVHTTPFGDAFIAISPKGVCRLAFVDDHDISRHLADLENTWSPASLTENTDSTGAIGALFYRNASDREPSLPLHVVGTDFQTLVWQALLLIPTGSLTSYSEIASTIGMPNASRAVGTAIGANPIAYFIPCHRVIQQSGKLGGYHWGLLRKQAMINWETARNICHTNKTPRLLDL